MRGCRSGRTRGIAENPPLFCTSFTVSSLAHLARSGSDAVLVDKDGISAGFVTADKIFTSSWLSATSAAARIDACGGKSIGP